MSHNNNSFSESIKEKETISIISRRLLSKLLKENQKLEAIMRRAQFFDQAINGIWDWVMEYMDENNRAYKFYKNEITGREAFDQLKWSDYAAIRILDTIDHCGQKHADLNLRGEKIANEPFRILWLAVKSGRGGANPAFFKDMLELFRQFSGSVERNLPSESKVMEWMDRHPSGLDPEIVKLRNQNKERILKVIISKMNDKEINDAKFSFEPGMTEDEKLKKAYEWWDNRLFHLRFAVRSPELLNEMLDFSLGEETMETLYEAKEVGIPFFVNPYYLSLLNVDVPDFAVGADQAIRCYVFYSKQLINEFGHIVAWEKEDIVKPGVPNAAGWLLPGHDNIHRRYPEVAILIPDTAGRACGGLCVSCQRMFDFQRGNLNFDLNKLKPKETWPVKLINLMIYFENDSQLRDILVTGGDALMNTDKSLKRIFDAIYDMAVNKINANKNRKDGEKYAEMLRIRLGTRLPVYLPQRITTELINILAGFKEKASKIGFKKFVIQTHFETAMEVTPEAAEGVKRLLSAGWIVTNQQVFTAGASRRGHTAKLREVLNDIGVLPYYTFIVKGYMENYKNFANTARAVQEQLEEKSLGVIPEKYYDYIKEIPSDAENMVEHLNTIRIQEKLRFLATDRNVLNLPGVGKSLTFRTIGLTYDGRRIIEFNHDRTRVHSPIINKMGKVIIIESKSISEYLNQIENMGEDIEEYRSIYGYSIGETEVRMPLYEYPDYEFRITETMTNLEI